MSARPSMRSFLRKAVRKNSRQDARLRLSMAGSSCIRDLYYRATGAPSEAVSDERLMKMAIGAALDEIALRHADGFRALAHQPVVVRMGDFAVHGTADLVLVDEKGPALVSDLKVVGDETWARVKNAPKPEHKAQVNLCAFGLGAARWSVCYVHAGSGEILEHFGDTDAFAAKRDFGQFEEVGYWLSKRELPPRPYEDVTLEDGTVKLACDQFPCRFCPHRTHCWETKEGSDVSVS